MPDSSSYLRVPQPTRAALAAARAALEAQQDAGDYVCGCFAARCRDPFFPPLVGHWRKFHPKSLALLEDAQAHRARLDLHPKTTT